MNFTSERTYGFNIPHTAIEGCLSEMKQDGLKLIEINIPHTLPLSEIFQPARVQRIRTLALEHRAGISLHVPFKVNISDVIPVIRRSNIKYLLSCIDIAAAVGAQMITVHIGTFYWFPLAHQTRRKALERFVENIGGILENCRNSGVRLALENVAPLPAWSDYHHLGDRIEDFIYIFGNVSSEYIGFCLDTGHAHLGEGTGAYLRALGAHLINVHLHDNAGNDDSHLMIGDGTIQWQDTANLFQTIGYTGPFISECRMRDPVDTALRMEEFFYNASPVKS